MRLKFLIFLLITLPYFICNLNIPKKKPQKFVKEVEQLNEYAKNGTEIANNSLILSEDGFLGEGFYAFVYAGKLVNGGHPVAIQFVPKSNIVLHETEFGIFEKLNAYKNPQIEEIGFPNIYYHGNWSSYHVTAMTKLDQSLADILEKGVLPLDMMILFKSFVIQTNYMHKHGICHGNVNSKHIMFRSNQSFIIDFQISRTMKDEKFKLSHKDWKQFLIMITNHYGIRFYWDDWNICKNALQGHKLDEGLKRIIEKFGDEAFSNDHSKSLPNYKRVKKIINKEINKNCGYWRFSSPQFSWLPN